MWRGLRPLSMCFHVSLRAGAGNLEKRFRIQFPPASPFQPLAHVSAFTRPILPVILNTQPAQVAFLRWGLVPSWARNREEADRLAGMTLNAVGETLFEKPSFRDAAATRRCLVPVDAFFEWHHLGKETYPFMVRLSNQQPFALGGVWSSWTDPVTRQVIRTFSVVTSQANGLMARVHNSKRRMPFILAPGQEDAWLHDHSPSAITGLIGPFPETELEAFPIARSAFREPGSDEAAFFKPVVYPELAFDFPELFS